MKFDYTLVVCSLSERRIFTKKIEVNHPLQVNTELSIRVNADRILLLEVDKIHIDVGDGTTFAYCRLCLNSSLRQTEGAIFVYPFIQFPTRVIPHLHGWKAIDITPSFEFAIADRFIIDADEMQKAVEKKFFPDSLPEV